MADIVADLSRLDAVVARIEAALDRLDRDGGAALARIEMALDSGVLRFASTNALPACVERNFLHLPLSSTQTTPIHVWTFVHCPHVSLLEYCSLF